MTGSVPGGVYNPPPPPPPRPAPGSASSGCLVWGLVGCGAILLALVVIGVIVIYVGARSPGFRQLIANSTTGPQCAQKLRNIGIGLREYRAQHKGRYPKTLAELVPRYILDNSTLACSDNPAQALEYTPPGPDAPRDMPVVTYSSGWAPYMNVGQQTMYTGQTVRLLKDGSVNVDAIQRTQVVPPD